ncbi:MAG: hypothetical protein WB808_12760 [Candidatus Dormiibacterota bacterium]
MIDSDNELIESLRKLVAQQPIPPDGWEDGLIRGITETSVSSSIPLVRSRRGRPTHQRWRPLWAEIGAALAIAAVVVLSIQAIFHPGPRSITGPVALTSPATSPTTRGPTSSPTAVGLSGFQPQAFTAVSESTFWVLGTNACAASGCVSEIMHTVDGGGSFHRIPAPPTDFLAGNVSTPGPPLVSDIRFADLSNGWVFGNTLWATHSGGAAWHQITLGGSLLGVDQLEPGANGYVYGVFEICTDPSTATGCVHRLMRSRATSDTWSVITPPGNPVGWPRIGVHGDTIWAMYFMRSTGLELISHDDGAVWVRGASACEPDLAGSLDPVTTTVIWAFCATGNSGGPMVSSNGGLAWASGGGIGGLFSNGATVAALSTQHAFLADPGSGLSVTANGGRTYQSIAELNAAVWVGFTDFEVGYVITHNQVTQASALWRTTDAGARWSPVAFA